MELSKKNPSCLYISDSEGIFFTKSLPSPLKFSFPKDVLAHLEIVDSQKLDELISKFIENKNIQPSQIFIILGEDTTFEKDLTDIPKAERLTEIQKFADLVPFEKTLNKVFKVQKKEKLVVANRDFCEKLIEVFSNKEFRVSAIAPLSIILNLIPKLKDKVDLPFLLKKIDMIKKYSLLSKEKESSLNFSTNSINSRLIILSIVFLILIIILGFMVYTKFLLP